MTSRRSDDGPPLVEWLVGMLVFVSLFVPLAYAASRWVLDDEAEAAPAALTTTVIAAVVFGILLWRSLGRAGRTTER